MLLENQQAQAGGSGAAREPDALRRLADYAPVLVWMHGPRGCEFVNRGYLDFLGVTMADVQGMGWAKYVPPDDYERYVSGYHAAAEKRALFESEFRFRRADGVYRLMRTVGLPHFSPAGDFLGYIGSTYDITDIKVGGERLRLLWEVAAVLLSANNPDAMLRELFAKIGPHVGVDVYFNYVVNDRGDALQLASCAGISVEAAQSIDRLEFGQAICGTVALQRQPIVASHIQRSDDPKVQLVKSFGIRAYACNPLVAENRLLGTLSFASRIKDQFELDDVAFLETICHYVTMAYERLRLVNELKEADRRKDEFLATLAHELRNSLAPVRNAVQVLRLNGPDEPELRWGRDVIERQVHHLTRLIDDLMDISRITLNKLELRKDRVELADVIKGAVESSRPLIEQCGHELTVILPPQPVYVNGDSVRLTQAFMNLLTNAAKYTERGGRIWLIAEREDGEVVVRVTDTGVGIPPEKLPRLFEMFYQLDHSLERSQGGLGIGLSLVRRLVEFHGGRVSGHSAGVGKGSEFTIRLPLLLDEPKPAKPQESGSNGQTTHTTARRILIVDDNRISADSLAKLLRLMGNDVHTAYDGLAGIEATERFRPDVVLLDISMPQLNGYDACRRIRAEKWGKDIVLIALTGWNQQENKRYAEEADFDAHMVKPVDANALLKLLSEFQPTQRPETALIRPEQNLVPPNEDRPSTAWGSARS
jgi:PAS domain S-box-containing protein